MGGGETMGPDCLTVEFRRLRENSELERDTRVKRSEGHFHPLSSQLSPPHLPKTWLG